MITIAVSTLLFQALASVALLVGAAAETFFSARRSLV